MAPLTALCRNGKEKIARRLKDINELIEEKEAEVQEQAVKLEQIRAKLGEIDKEISEAAVTLANLRENIRFRRLKRDLTATEAELDAIDMEEAAKAKRIWTEKWNMEKQKETDLQTKVRLGRNLSVQGDTDGIGPVVCAHRRRTEFPEIAAEDVRKRHVRLQECQQEVQGPAHQSQGMSP